MISDLSDYKNISDIYLLFFAILTVDVFVMFLARYFPEFFGSALNRWYDDFQLSAVLSDVLIILIGFIIARYIYTIWIKPEFGWNPFLFVGLVVLIQAIHDALFYLFVIKPLPKGHNLMIDLFKTYSKGGLRIIGGDAMLMIMSALVGFLYKSLDQHVVVGVNVLVLYALPYILNTSIYQS
jgi:hypothetical protein